MSDLFDEIEQTAKNTKTDLHEALGRAERLHDAGKLKRWLIVLDWTDEEEPEGYSRTYHSHATDALGLAELAKHVVLTGYKDVDDPD